MFARVDGIRTRYEIVGDGPPVLLFSPGGFNATLGNWGAFGIYARLGLVEALSRRFSCVVFDRRESGQSGGRVERLTWARYTAQARGLLDHLEIDRAHVIGGCIGCSCAASFAVDHRDRVERIVLYSPAGGPRYRLSQRARFADHLAFVDARGLAAVVELATASESTFSQDPRVGLWATVIRTDREFAARFAELDPGEYRQTVEQTCSSLFDRDTVPGADPEALLALDIPALVVPGRDAAHATSAARYLEECLEGSEYWDAPPEAQTAETAPPRLLAFLEQ
jgi:pimeloyl-ACP methyl ester carboxylesterase